MSKPRLLKDTLLYALTGVATKLIGALLLPLLTRLLTPGEYGAIDIVTLGGLVVIELVLLGTDFMLALYYHDAAIDRRRLNGTLLALRLGLGGTIGLIVWCLAPTLARWGLATAGYDLVPAIRVAAATLPASGLASLWMVLMRQQGRSGALLLVTLLRVALTAAATAALLWRAADRVTAYFWAIFLADVGLALLLSGLFRRAIGRPALALARELLLKGIAYLPRGIYFALMALVTRQLLLRFGSLEEVGQYAVAVKISYIVWIAISASNQAWLAYSLSIAGQPDAPLIYRRYLSAYVSVMGLAVAAVALFAPEILRVLATAAYVGTAPAVGWQTFSLLAVGALVIVSTGLNIAKETAVVGRTTIAAGALNIALAVPLISFSGLLGASIAAAADQCFAVVALYRAAQRRHPLPFAVREALGWSAAILACVIAATLLPLETTPWLLSFKALVLLVYAAALLKRGYGRMLLTLFERFKRRQLASDR